METALTKGEKSSQAILIAAHDLFTEQGYHGTSMRQIAERAGIALGGIYNHFKNKEEIFSNVVMSYHPYHQVLPAMIAAEGETVEEILLEAAMLIEEGIRGRTDLIKLMLIENVEFENKHVPQLLNNILPSLMQFLQRFGQLQGEQTTYPLEVILRAYISFIMGYYLTQTLGSEVFASHLDSPSLQSVTQIFLHGIFKSPENGTQGGIA